MCDKCCCMCISDIKHVFKANKSKKASTTATSHHVIALNMQLSPEGKQPGHIWCTTRGWQQSECTNEKLNRKRGGRQTCNRWKSQTEVVFIHVRNETVILMRKTVSSFIYPSHLRKLMQMTYRTQKCLFGEERGKDIETGETRKMD